MSTLLDYYRGRTILVTGGSGFVGTALCYKLVISAHPTKIYVLIRGSVERLWDRWSKVLPAAQYNTLRNSGLIVPIVGDAATPGTLGLDSATITSVREEVSVCFNLASKTRIVASLATIKQTDIDPAVCVAEFATTCKGLDRFVWTSSAYSNAQLHWQDPNATLTTVGEQIYDAGNPEEELSQIVASGTSDVYRRTFFSSQYGYCKNLTERLIISRYQDKLPHLLIIRPSCIGPALREPAPGYEIMGSSPITTLMSYTIHRSTNSLTGAYHLPTRKGLGFSTFINECPVDIVVNRILAHTSVRTTGITHAVVGRGVADQQLTLGDYWTEFTSTIPRPLCPTVEWVDDATLLQLFKEGSQSFVDAQFGAVPRGFAFCGAAFNFEDGKTVTLETQLSAVETQELPLFVDGKEELLVALKTRKKRNANVIASELQSADFFKPPDSGSGIFDGHIEAGILSAPLGTAVQVIKDTAALPGAVLEGAVAGAGTHRFPFTGAVVGGTAAGVEHVASSATRATDTFLGAFGGKKK